MDNHIASILELVKTSCPIPINDENMRGLKNNIEEELHKTLKKILTKWIEKNFRLNDINYNDDDNNYYDDSIVNLEMDRKRLDSKIDKNTNIIVEKIIYDYVNIMCLKEYADGNREKVITYIPYIDINYDTKYKNYRTMLHYATKKEDIEMIKIILDKKPKQIYQVYETKNLEIMGLFIDYICDNELYVEHNERSNIFYNQSKIIREFICKHPRAKEFLKKSYDKIAKKYFNNNNSDY
ncbi:ankyrin repeat protein [Megavirus baoshan]|uniref:Ankyrin repeat protein n=1 Tax=Megavirus baoshan TaxID=2496520 RepID=A0A3S8UXZ5_9VIRU|nr:ankyrin repeat protein [Megavirus baoshan]AZL89682.1 ankyrin repeat protein [Megavirus baoshan]